METSDIISILALAVAVFSAIAGYIYMRRTFVASSKPRISINIKVEEPDEMMKLEGLKFVKNAPELVIYATNLSSNVPIINVKTTVIISDQKGKLYEYTQPSEGTYRIEPQNSKSVYFLFNQYDFVGKFSEVLELRSIAKEDVVTFLSAAINHYIKNLVSENKSSLSNIEVDEIYRQTVLLKNEYTSHSFPDTIWYYRVKDECLFNISIKLSYTPGIPGGKPISLSHHITTIPKSLTLQDLMLHFYNQEESFAFLPNELNDWIVQEKWR